MSQPTELWWTAEEFEEHLVRGLIALLEERPPRAFRPDLGNCHRMSVPAFRGVLAAGPCFDPGDRAAWGGTDSIAEYDLPYLPRSYCHANPKDYPNSEPDLLQNDSWFNLYGYRFADRYGPDVQPLHVGTPVQLFVASWQNNGKLDVACHWATLTDFGRVVEVMEFGRGGWSRSKPWGPKNTVPQAASLFLQFAADRRFLWNVQAREGGARVNFGVYENQIQSLLYARTQPLTATGRRRPILHWVRSHRRRVKSGTPIEIPRHLRGVRRFVMHGTEFEITAPVCRGAPQ